MVLGYFLEREFLVRRIIVYILDDEYGFTIYGIICGNQFFTMLNDLFCTDVVLRYTALCCNVPGVIVRTVAVLYPLTQLDIFAVAHAEFCLIPFQLAFQQPPYFSGDAFSELHNLTLLAQAA